MSITKGGMGHGSKEGESSDTALEYYAHLAVQCAVCVWVWMGNELHGIIGTFAKILYSHFYWITIPNPTGRFISSRSDYCTHI